MCYGYSWLVLMDFLSIYIVTASACTIGPSVIGIDRNIVLLFCAHCTGNCWPSGEGDMKMFVLLFHCCRRHSGRAVLCSHSISCMVLKQE